MQPEKILWWSSTSSKVRCEMSAHEMANATQKCVLLNEPHQKVNQFNPPWPNLLSRFGGAVWGKQLVRKNIQNELNNVQNKELKVKPTVVYVLLTRLFRVCWEQVLRWRNAVLDQQASKRRPESAFAGENDLLWRGALGEALQMRSAISKLWASTKKILELWQSQSFYMDGTSANVSGSTGDNQELWEHTPKLRSDIASSLSSRDGYKFARLFRENIQLRERRLKTKSSSKRWLQNAPARSSNSTYSRSRQTARSFFNLPVRTRGRTPRHMPAQDATANKRACFHKSGWFCE